LLAPLLQGVVSRHCLLGRSYFLQKSLYPRDFRDGKAANKPYAWKRNFAIWDNRDRPLVKGEGCVAL